MAPDTIEVKEKASLLVGINTSRHYERSMIYHIKGEIDGGTSLEELIEYLATTYVVGGEETLKMGLQSFEYAAPLVGRKIEF